MKLTAIVDASQRADLGVTGIGIVLRATDRPGREGPVIAQIAEAHVDVSIGEIELFAVLCALEIARDRGFRNVKVRSDDNPMRRRLKCAFEAGDLGGPHSLQGRTMALARTFERVVFAYQRRRKNGAAHRLARSAWESWISPLDRSRSVLG